MSKLIAYIGGAGTGKTTQLINELEALIKLVSWSKFNGVLALTFMHGSRRRLEKKLSFLKNHNIQYKCITIDAFSTQMVERFRSYFSVLKNTLTDYEKYYIENQQARTSIVDWNLIRNLFIKLLTFKVIQDYLANSYPIVIVDEFQDCENSLLEVIKGILKCDITVLIAGDDFQYLSNSEKCEATEWLTDNFDIIELNKVHRTNNSAILSTATGIRNNSTIVNSVPVQVLYTPELAAWRISSLIQWKRWGTKGKSLVLLYPVSPEKSRFVKKVLQRLEKPFLNPRTPLNANPFYLEDENKINIEALIQSIREQYNGSNLSIEILISLSKNGSKVISNSANRARYLGKIRGSNNIEMEEFEGILIKELHFQKIFCSNFERAGRAAMTIHAAKNREFDQVIILWPYETRKDEIYRRKLLYNSITRAKEDVLIIVQAKNEDTFKRDHTFACFDNIEIQK